MPSVELVECEKVAYINGMKEYLQNLKNMEHSQAKKVSFENLKKKWNNWRKWGIYRAL